MIIIDLFVLTQVVYLIQREW